MNERYAQVISKVRPIKKLFLIEPNDINAFIAIVKLLSTEICGYKNIILINNEKLFSQNTIDYIKKTDPDCIINYSQLNEAKIRVLFNTVIFNHDKIVLEKLVTHIFMLDNYLLANNYAQQNIVEDQVYVNFDLGSQSNDIQKILYFGLIDNDFKSKIKTSIFSETELIQADDFETVLKAIKNPKLSFFYLSQSISFSLGNGSSIFEKCHNRFGYHSKEPLIILGAKDNLESMVYYWNTRASYPRTKSIWITADELFKYSEHFQSYNFYCDFTNNKDIEDVGKKTKLNIKKIPNDIIYFHNYLDDWKLLEQTHYLPIANNKLILFHPKEKSFSTQGYNDNIVLELRGLEEFVFPVSQTVGELFYKDINKKYYPELFSRISHSGLSVYGCDFDNPISNNYSLKINLPLFDEMMDRYFQDREIILEETIKTTLINKVIDLVGWDNLVLLKEKEIFDLLVQLTPKRLSRIINELRVNVNSSSEEEEFEKIILNNFQNIESFTSNIVVTVEEMLKRIKSSKEQKNNYIKIINKMYESKYFLRGKYFKCPSCQNNLWYAIDKLSKNIICYFCDEEFLLPMLNNNESLSDSYKLNELLIKAVDQGQLTSLLTALFFYQQPIRTREFLFNMKTTKKSKNDDFDFDIIVKLGKRIGLIEVKSDRGFSEEQTNKLLDYALQIKADFVSFASLKDKKSSEIEWLCKHLLDLDLTIPVFILPSETLFSKEVINITNYFQINQYNEFPKGPICL